MANDTLVWFTDDLQQVDPRGWADTMTEVGEVVPQLGAYVQEQELLDSFTYDAEPHQPR